MSTGRLHDARRAVDFSPRLQSFVALRRAAVFVHRPGAYGLVLNVVQTGTGAVHIGTGDVLRACCGVLDEAVGAADQEGVPDRLGSTSSNKRMLVVRCFSGTFGRHGASVLRW